MGKVVLSGYIEVPVAELAAVTAALPEHIKQTREEAGCLFFDVHPDEAVGGKFLVYEEFVSPAAFAAHQRRVRDSAWGRITQDVVRHYQVTGLDEIA